MVCCGVLRQAFGPLADVATFDGAAHAFISFQSVQPACRAFELLDGQQVPVLTGQRPFIVKFRPLAINARLLRPGSSASNGCDSMPALLAFFCTTG